MSEQVKVDDTPLPMNSKDLNEQDLQNSIIIKPSNNTPSNNVGNFPIVKPLKIKKDRKKNAPRRNAKQIPEKLYKVFDYKTGYSINLFEAYVINLYILIGIIIVFDIVILISAAINLGPDIKGKNECFNAFFQIKKAIFGLAVSNLIIDIFEVLLKVLKNLQFQERIKAMLKLLIWVFFDLLHLSLLISILAELSARISLMITMKKQGMKATENYCKASYALFFTCFAFVLANILLSLLHLVTNLYRLFNIYAYNPVVVPDEYIDKYNRMTGGIEVISNVAITPNHKNYNNYPGALTPIPEQSNLPMNQDESTQNHGQGLGIINQKEDFNNSKRELNDKECTNMPEEGFEQPKNEPANDNINNQI